MATPTQTVKVQHGCGCISGLGTLFLVYLCYSALSDAPAQLEHNKSGFTGIVGLIALLGLIAYAIWYRATGRVKRDKERRTAAVPVPVATEKACPDCGETVQVAARICRFCRFDFTQLED